MKLRLAMRVVYTDFVSSMGLSPQQLGEQAVAHSVGVMQSNADNAQLSSLAFGKDGNPLYTACMYNSPAWSVTGGDSHAAADIICYMNGYNDNRRASYFEESKWPGETYVGLRRGINLSKMKEYFINYSRVKISSSDPVLWMNAAEVAFLRAEATAIYGFNMKGTAADFYEQGVRLSFEQWVATGVDSYLADESSVHALYKDPDGLNTYEKNHSTISD